MTLPESIDPLLWFTTKKYGEERRFYFWTINPQTFIGRMYAFDPNKNQSFAVSKFEIASMSNESQYFVSGFLTGNEPPPPKCEDGRLAEDDPGMIRWRRAVKLFSSTGAWKDGRVCEKCGGEILPSTPPGFVCEVCLGISD